MEILAVVVILFLIIFMVYKNKASIWVNIKLKNNDLEQIFREIITFHGLASNTETGFSCYISDPPPFSKNEGLLLWNYSKTYNRIETQVQKFSTQARVQRMKDIFGLSFDEYDRIFINYFIDYINRFKSLESSYELGKGVTLFGKYPTKNVAIAFSDILKNPKILLKLEELTINNMIIDYYEQNETFKCENKKELIVNNYLIYPEPKWHICSN